jgi:hypothetical protein
MEFSAARGADDVLLVNDDLNEAYLRLEQWALR